MNTVVLNDLPDVSQVLGEVPPTDDSASSDPGRVGPEADDTQQASPRDSKRECIAFILGQCSRGARCRYAHVPPGPAECRDFKAGHCHRGNKCVLQHVPVQEICRKYLRGECALGERCRRRHSREVVVDVAEVRVLGAARTLILILAQSSKPEDGDTKVGRNNTSHRCSQNDVSVIPDFTSQV